MVFNDELPLYPLLFITAILEISLFLILPFSAGAKFLIIIFTSVAIYFIANCFYVSIDFLLHSPHFIASAIVTFIVFCAVPLACHVIIEHNESAMQKHYQNVFQSNQNYNNEAIYLTTIDVSEAKSSGKIGNEWSYLYQINGTPFKSGDKITLPYNKVSSLFNKFTEFDEYDDIGYKTINLSPDYMGNHYRKYASVLVEETGGRSNKGSYVVFDVFIDFQKILHPEIEAQFSDLNNTQLFFIDVNSGTPYIEISNASIIILAFGGLCLLLIIFVPILANHLESKRLSIKSNR